MSQDFSQLLEAVLQREFPDFCAPLRCQQLSAGASQETYCLTYGAGNREIRLALRRSHPTAIAASSVGGIELETEAQLFQLATSNGIPGPEVKYVLGKEDGLGHGYIMQWLDGETLGQRIVHAPELNDIRDSLARSCGEILGRIHALDVQSTNLASKLSVVEPEQLVEETWLAYCALNVPVPMIDYTWRWLKDNLPTESRSTLVHGDFRNGNLMVTPQGINAVLDWELAHIGDPLRDLGWLCVNSWRFGVSHKPVGGFGSVDELLEGYQSTSGVTVSRDELRFWQVFGSFWWAMATLQMANSWRTGETPSLERPVIGRRSSEAQMDCVNLLIPGEIDLPNEAPSPLDGTQLPMPEELLSGIITFLKEEVAPNMDGHNHFLARVAANSLKTAQRELQFGQGAAEREHSRLQKLLNGDGSLDSHRRQLVEQLRAQMPLEQPGLANHLRQSVATQLFIDQPRYSGLK